MCVREWKIFATIEMSVRAKNKKQAREIAKDCFDRTRLPITISHIADSRPPPTGPRGPYRHN